MVDLKKVKQKLDAKRAAEAAKKKPAAKKDEPPKEEPLDTAAVEEVRKSDSFPLVSVMEQADMDEAKLYMDMEVDYQEQESAIVKARAEIKAKLKELGHKYNLPGFRYGNLATYVTPLPGKRTFQTDVLMLNHGLTTDDLDACYKTGKPGWKVEVRDLSKPRGKKRSGEEEEGR